MIQQDCFAIQDALLERDRLPADQRRQLDDHLNQCPACREEAQRMQELETWMNDAEFRAPADLAESVMSRLASEPAPTPVRAEFLTLGAACILLLAFTVGWNTTARVATWLGGGLETVRQLLAGAITACSAAPTSLPAVSPWTLAPHLQGWSWLAVPALLIFLFALVTLFEARPHHAKR